MPEVSWQLVLEVPVADAGLSTTRVALMRTPTQLEYYARSQLDRHRAGDDPDPDDRVFRKLTGHRCRRPRIVGLRADFILKLELREFQAEYFHGAAPSVHVAINAKLVQMPRRTIIGSENFGAISPAAADDLMDIIAAFDVALGKVLKRLVEWALITGEAAYEGAV